MPHPPATLVRGLVKGDAVNPRPQGRLTVKAPHAPEDLDEDFLGQVGGIGPVMHGPRQQRVNRLVVVRYQPRKGFFRAGPEFINESRLVRLERERAGNIAHGEVRLHSESSHDNATSNKLARTFLGGPNCECLLCPLVPAAKLNRRKPDTATECAGCGTLAGGLMFRALYCLRHRNTPKVFPVTPERRQMSIGNLLHSKGNLLSSMV